MYFVTFQKRMRLFTQILSIKTTELILNVLKVKKLREKVQEIQISITRQNNR